MLSGGNDTVWMEREHDDAVSWPRQASLIANSDASAEPKSDANGENDISFSISPTFKSMLNAGDWYVTSAGSSCAPLPPPLPPPNQLLHDLATQPEGIITGNTLLLQQPSFTTSPSCFPSPSFSLDPSQSHHYLPPPKSYLSSILSVACSNPYDSNACDYITDPAFLGTMQSDFMNFNGMSSQPEIVTQEQGSSSEFPALVSGFSSTGYEGYEGSTNPMSLVRRNKVLRPLETLPTIETSTTLFQKRAMLRQSSNGLEDSGFSDMSFGESLELGDNNWVKKRKRSGEAELGVGDGTFDVSGFSYDSEELNETSRIDECARIEGNNSSSNAKSKVNVHGGGGCDRKGKKKGMPAKNLMAERRRRKKLNDRLYMLRSVVPKISRMDRASILGDAIDYLKDLLQRINDVHNELEAVQPGSLMPTTSFDPLSPAPATLPCRVKEELSNSLVIPRNQTAKVEVQASEGRTVNIHMFCARRPGLLLSTLTSLNSLGLDIQQAVISCFNGFALDVFRAEQCMEGQDILPDQIKDVLLDSAGFHGVS